MMTSWDETSADHYSVFACFFALACGRNGNNGG